ncbi:MAG: D-hexose-6-phosphate mutarotase [Betaproteobacteria bacterium]
MRLKTPAGATAIVSLQGAQVLSWIPASGGERLYLSDLARFGEGAAIRGGVPVIFPQFGTFGPGQRHGFARGRSWRLESVRQEGGFACVVLQLGDDAETRALWPHAFMVELTVMIEENRLDIELEVFNRDTTGFEFSVALHTYLRLGNVELARLEGLEGKDYIDCVNGRERRHDSRYALLVDDAVDRIYLGIDRPLLLSETGRQLAIEQSGFGDTVVWNPWESGMANLPDMAPLDFKRMLCVEAASVEPPVMLAPEKSWCGRQTLVAL